MDFDDDDSFFNDVFDTFENPPKPPVGRQSFVYAESFALPIVVFNYSLLRVNKATQYGPGSARKSDPLIAIDRTKAGPKVTAFDDFPEDVDDYAQLQRTPVGAIIPFKHNTAEQLRSAPSTVQSPKKAAKPNTANRSTANVTGAVDDLQTFPAVNNDPGLEPPTVDPEAIKTWNYPSTFPVSMNLHV